MYTVGKLPCLLSRYTGEITFKVKYSCLIESRRYYSNFSASIWPILLILWWTWISNIFAMFLMGVLKGHLKKKEKIPIHCKMAFFTENPHVAAPSRSEDWTQWSMMSLTSNVQIWQNRCCLVTNCFSFKHSKPWHHCSDQRKYGGEKAREKYLSEDEKQSQIKF